MLERLFAEADDLLVCDAVVAEAFSKGTDDERRAIASLIDAVEYVSTAPDAPGGPARLAVSTGRPARGRSATPSSPASRGHGERRS
jgi:hypothetical protein